MNKGTDTGAAAPEPGLAARGAGPCALAFQGFRKVFGEAVALAGLDLEVEPGTIVGLLGPGGAGKTTAIRAVCGLLAPTAGRVEVLGEDARHRRHAIRPRLGYMPQVPALYEDLTAAENVEFHALAHEVVRPYQRVREVLALVGLAKRSDAPAHTLSGGMKQRLSLACALVHEPPVLLLDEPTAGIDPELRRAFWDHFRTLRDAGATLLISTHQLDEAFYCDTLAILRAGALLVVDRPDRVLDRGRTRVTITRPESRESTELDDYRTQLPRLLERHGLSAEVEEIAVERDTLEEVFIRLVARRTPGAGPADAPAEDGPSAEAAASAEAAQSAEAAASAGAAAAGGTVGARPGGREA